MNLVGGLPVEMAKTDVRGGGQVRTQQLKMGEKAIEERRRRRRKEGEGELVSQRRKPQLTSQGALKALGGEWGTHGEGSERRATGPVARRAGRLGWPGVLPEPAGAEAVYLVFH